MSHPKVNLFELEELPRSEPWTVQPRSVTLDITHLCPFNCPECIEGGAMRYTGRSSLNLRTVLRLLERMEDYGVRELLLYGGEPTAHPEFHRIVREAAVRVRSLRLVTNGAYLHLPRVRDAIFEASLLAEVHVRLSLNAGTEAMHDRLHGVRGFFRRIVEGAGALVEGGISLGISFLLEEANAPEALTAYEIAENLGAGYFSLRPKTGPHGIGLLPLGEVARRKASEAVRTMLEGGTRLEVPGWFVRWLDDGTPPDLAKPYPYCYYCAATRVVVTPPDPGLVWACTYWRADPRFFVADLGKVEFGSAEFEGMRTSVNMHIRPHVHCAPVICNRNEANKAIWNGREVAAA